MVPEIEGHFTILDLLEVQVYVPEGYDDRVTRLLRNEATRHLKKSAT